MISRMILIHLFYLIHFPHKSMGYSSRLFLFPVLLICLFWMPFLHPFKQQSFMDPIDRSIRKSRWLSPMEITSSEEPSSSNKISNSDHLMTRARYTGDGHFGRSALSRTLEGSLRLKRRTKQDKWKRIENHQQDSRFRLEESAEVKLSLRNPHSSRWME